MPGGTGVDTAGCLHHLARRGPRIRQVGRAHAVLQLIGVGVAV